MGNRARIPVARLGTAALRRVALPAAGLWKKQGGVLPPDPGEAIMQACVLWYDIRRQGATNEGMAANPVLRDLSGNGRDATCYNFAWTEGSGIVTDDAGPCLLFDGVDDYAKVEGLSLLTLEKGYTVFVKGETLRKYGTVCFATKSINNGITQGAFAFIEGMAATRSFGVMSNITRPDSDILWQTSKSCCGQSIKTGSATDTDFLTLGKHADIDSRVSNMKLYSFILFDRDLTEEEIEWVKENMVEYKEVTEDWYGVEFYTTSPYPDCIRIGNMDLHRSLPVQSAMKGCLLNDDGEVVKYLDENDWTSETRDGSQGQVMVEIPDHYVKFETEGNIRRVKMSMSPLDGFKKVARHYIGAYEAALQRSTSKLASVATADPDYRGGSNVPNRDEKFNTLLGRPVSSIGFTDARNYARNRNGSATAEWNCITYDAWKTLYWLFVVEYATLDSQKPLVEGKGQDGFMQGGLGNGVTNINATKWQAYYQSVFIPCGFTDGLGNRTGQMPFTMAFEYDANGSLYYNGEYDPGTAYTDGQFVSQGEDLYECVANAPAGTALSDTAYFKKVARTITYVNRYRGIEMPFGHLFKMVDGIVFIYTAIDNKTVKGEALACSDPAKFSFESYDGYALLGDVGVYGKSYIKEVMFGENGDIVIKAGGGSYDSYFCDGIRTQDSFSPGYTYIGTMVFGGCASYGLTAGLLYEDSYTNPRTYGNSQTGTRLCFIPEQKNKSI